MIKRLNKSKVQGTFHVSLGKRGQEGFSTTGLLAMVIGVIALVVLAMFIWRAYSQPGDIVDLIPDEFQKAMIYCENSPFASQDKIASYCGDYKEFEIKGKTYYYNCYQLAQLAPTEPQWNINRGIICTEEHDKGYCGYLNRIGSIEETVMVNKHECKLSSSSDVASQSAVKLGVDAICEPNNDQCDSSLDLSCKKDTSDEIVTDGQRYTCQA